MAQLEIVPGRLVELRAPDSFPCSLHVRTQTDATYVGGFPTSPASSRGPAQRATVSKVHRRLTTRLLPKPRERVGRRRDGAGKELDKRRPDEGRGGTAEIVTPPIATRTSFSSFQHKLRPELLAALGRWRPLLRPPGHLAGTGLVGLVVPHELELDSVDALPAPPPP